MPTILSEGIVMQDALRLMGRVYRMLCIMRRGGICTALSHAVPPVAAQAATSATWGPPPSRGVIYARELLQQATPHIQFAFRRTQFVADGYDGHTSDEVLERCMQHTKDTGAHLFDVFNGELWATPHITHYCACPNCGGKLSGTTARCRMYLLDVLLATLLMTPEGGRWTKGGFVLAKLRLSQAVHNAYTSL